MTSSCAALLCVCQYRKNPMRRLVRCSSRRSRWIRTTRKPMSGWPGPTSVTGSSNGLKIRAALDRAIEAAKKAVALDDSLAEAHTLLGWTLLWKKQHDLAIAELERAVSLDPNSAMGIRVSSRRR